MNLLKLSLAGLRGSMLVHALNILLLGLGLGTVTLLMLMTGALRDRLTHDIADIDLVVGARGSPLQLVLSTVFAADIPTGNIPLSAVDDLSRNPLVASAIPVSLGDAVKGFRIVGTIPGYIDLYHAGFAAGHLWNGPMEAVLGADAARLGLKPGDSFVGAHGIGGGGHIHADHPYIVTGVLARTGSVIDRLVLTSLESVWKVHEGHHEAMPDHDGGGKEVTAVLLHVASPLAVITLPHTINANTAMQAAVPSLEYARLLSLTGIGLDILNALAAVLIVASGLGMFIALYTRLKAREQDLAVFRLLGASRVQLFATVMTEGLALSMLGALTGIGLGHGAGWMLIWSLPQGHAFGGMSLGLRSSEWLVPGVALLDGVTAALIPAITAYSHDVSRALAGNAAT